MEIRFLPAATDTSYPIGDPTDIQQLHRPERLADRLSTMKNRVKGSLAYCHIKSAWKI